MLPGLGAVGVGVFVAGVVEVATAGVVVEAVTSSIGVDGSGVVAGAFLQPKPAKISIPAAITKTYLFIGNSQRSRRKPD